MDPLKVGAAVAAVGIGATGAGFGVFNYLNAPYSLKNFLDGSSEKSSAYEGKLGDIGNNKALFLANMPENKKWWEERFKDWSKETEKSTEFDNLKTYSTEVSDNKAINNVCDAAYKLGVSTAFTSTDSGTNKVKYKQNIAKYCTISGNDEGITWTVATSSGG
ncbi:hypothetical protein [Candidatus Mycoplasma haematohominis]|uniref:hypothetical protein n=1 Tax=Candidatus Mycoplasma haematohominis TaxID=1494318 RepID=UPI001C0A68E6|nr:hypothetical protein [Candidatus Mycoplasma haemohominis]